MLFDRSLLVDRTNWSVQGDGFPVPSDVLVADLCLVVLKFQPPKPF
jgi:hypothetical protein